MSSRTGNEGDGEKEVDENGSGGGVGGKAVRRRMRVGEEGEGGGEEGGDRYKVEDGGQREMAIRR